MPIFPHSFFSASSNESGRRLYWPTLLLTLWILSSAFFARDLYNLGVAIVGTHIEWMLWGLLLAVPMAGIPLWKTLPGTYRIWRMAGLLLLTVPTVMFILFFAEAISEKMHLIYMGILAWLVQRDLRYGTPRSTAILNLGTTFFFCLLVAALDETLQYFIPDRVGDPRDLLFAPVGALWGGLSYLTCYGVRPR
ncbi:MAG: VanZ family protein [Leptospiraceae bacterium]|nr:VanZ family protein [Leptospiraceae bacterium]